MRCPLCLLFVKMNRCGSQLLLTHHALQLPNHLGGLPLDMLKWKQGENKWKINLLLSLFLRCKLVGGDFFITQILISVCLDSFPSWRFQCFYEVRSKANKQLGCWFVWESCLRNDSCLCTRTHFLTCSSLWFHVFLVLLHLDWNSLGSGLFHSASAASSITKPCSCNTDLDAVALLSPPLRPLLQR